MNSPLDQVATSLFHIFLEQGCQTSFQGGPFSNLGYR